VTLPPPARPTTPPPPERAGTPFAIGTVPIPSRFNLAPLAGYTGLPYRLAVRELGGLGLATTDLVNARSLLEGSRRALELVETSPEDRPLAIQIYGSEPDRMAEAARRVVGHGASIVDINMGCPVRKVVRGGGGSALMCEATAAVRLVEAVVEAAGVPVTVKMRLGWDAENHTAPGLARAFEGVGVAAVIIHGRTRDQGFSGHADLGGIRAVVEAVERMPIVGNGDVRTIADADRMFRVTGCAAVSIGRGALGNPFLFRQLARWAETGEPGPDATFEERIEVMERHFARLLEARGERFACLQFRKMTRHYSHLIRPHKELYQGMINLPSRAVFEEVTAAVRRAGPALPLPGHFEPRIAVPSGPMDKW
jgi:nifR3 family TIM-barrel protein